MGPYTIYKNGSRRYTNVPTFELMTARAKAIAEQGHEVDVRNSEGESILSELDFVSYRVGACRECGRPVDPQLTRHFDCSEHTAALAGRI